MSLLAASQTVKHSLRWTCAEKTAVSLPCDSEPGDYDVSRDAPSDRTSLQAIYYKTVLVLIIHDPKVACFLILTSFYLRQGSSV